MKIVIMNKREEGVTLNISRENTKMGKVPSFSVTPIVTCPYGVPCYKECYAQRSCVMYEDTRDNYWENTEAIRTSDPEIVANALAEFINWKGWKVFRWNVGGDFNLRDYFTITCKVAEKCPGTQFLAFTKCYWLAERKRPKNYSMVLSAWNNYQPPKGIKCPVAYFKDGTTEIPSHAKKCSGKCDECFKCFFMKPGSAVYFEKH